MKHFRPDYYEHVRPVLAERMAAYITTHGGNYERTAAFTQGRYAEVMRDAMQIAGVEFPVFPDPEGAICLPEEKRCQYWVKYWIQLFLEIASWLSPDERKQAEARLKKAGVEYRLRPTLKRKRRR